MRELIHPGVVSYNAGVLGAQLYLTALSSVQGRVIREGVHWQLLPVSPPAHDPDKSYRSEMAQPHFILTPGVYTLRVHYQGEWNEVGALQLEQNTSTDIVLILENSCVDDESEYFSGHDVHQDFARRQQERDAQSIYGLATLPLRDPDPHISGEMGVQFMAHPLLQLPQFDGIPPDMRPDPHENKEALQLTLAQKLAAAPTTAPTPTMHLR